MNTQISFLIPTFFDAFSKSDNHLDSLFEHQGTLEEILLLGSKVPIGSTLVSPPDSRSWLCLELVHLHATRDHIVLMDPAMVRITSEEEQALRLSVMETLEEFLGHEGQFSNQRWLFPADPFSDIITHSPWQARGLNIDIWMPKDKNTPGLAKKWRQLQNEIQMIWHDHPVNEARIARGELPVNSVWIYGIGNFSDLAQHPILGDVTAIFSTHPLGYALDHRIQPLRTQLNMPKAGEHHFIFGQDLNALEWQSLWSAAIDALHTNKVDRMTCFDWQNNAWVSHVLHTRDLQTNWFSQLFRKKETTHPFSTWTEFVKHIKWSSL
jgi:hypothetical protein